jgi:Rha family phage regulatory protein
MKELVQNIDGRAVTTSRKVAEIFEKQHRNVLRDIRELEIPEEYRELNFEQTVYEQPNPSGGKPIQQPEYLITRDGFTILAMGFTGKKAMQFKIAYIEAFNAMEEAIKNSAVKIANYERNIAPGVNASTLELIDCINRRILSGGTVDKEVLRYAWNVGRLVAKQAVSIYPDELTAFIKSFPAGEFTRNDVYDQYCACCSDPISPRRFWPCVRAIRPCSDKRTSCARIVVFK